MTSAASQGTVAHVDAERGFSGGEVQLFLLIEGLRRAGWRNVLFCPPGSASEARARSLGIECMAVAMRNELDGAAVLGLRRGFERAGAALAHLHTGRATWLGGWAARFAGIPAITTRRMDRDVERGVRTKLVYGTLTRRAVAISPAVADCLRRGGVPEDRIRTIWSSIDVDSQPRLRPPADVRRELETEGDARVVFLTLGALVHRKGIDVALEALHHVASEAGELALWIAGQGEERERLEALARPIAGSSFAVRFLGHRRDAPDLLNACDVLLMPSRREGLGVASLEAMALGKPVIASRVGGLAQVVEHERTGLLVEPGDPAALGAAIARLLRDADARKLYGVQGRERVCQRFSARGMVDAYADLYREILAEASS